LTGTEDQTTEPIKNKFYFGEIEYSDSSYLEKLDFDQVKAYDFNGRRENVSILRIMRRRQYSLVSKDTLISKELAKKFITIVTDTNTYGQSFAACFEPSLGFIFFKENKAIYEINVCLDCNSLQASSAINAVNHHIYIDTVNSTNSYFNFGFSKTGQQAIIDFCKEITFHYGDLKQEDLYFQ
jgi:hypothetical protein